MKTINAIIAMTSLITNTAFTETVNLDDPNPDGAPAAWTATETGQGEAKRTIEKDETAPGKPNEQKQSRKAGYPVC